MTAPGPCRTSRPLSGLAENPSRRSARQRPRRSRANGYTSSSQPKRIEPPRPPIFLRKIPAILDFSQKNRPGSAKTYRHPCAAHCRSVSLNAPPSGCWANSATDGVFLDIELPLIAQRLLGPFVAVDALLVGPSLSRQPLDWRILRAAMDQRFDGRASNIRWPQFQSRPERSHPPPRSSPASPHPPHRQRAPRPLHPPASPQPPAARASASCLVLG